MLGESFALHAALHPAATKADIIVSTLSAVGA